MVTEDSAPLCAGDVALVAADRRRPGHSECCNDPPINRAPPASPPPTIAIDYSYGPSSNCAVANQLAVRYFGFKA